LKVAFYIARRYLFSKKSHNAINIISLVSVCGVVVVTAALVCALSVMNGFNQIVFSMFSGLDPDLKITPTMGKVFDPSSDEIQKVRRLPGVANICEVLQDNALVRYKDRQDICVIKGVGDNYSRLTTIDSILVDGIFTLSDEVADYATLGIGLAVSLAVNAHFISPLEIYAPKRDEKVNLANPSTSFNLQYAYINAVFQTNQQAYDDGFLIVPLSLTRTLFNYETEVSALELKLVDGANPETVKKQIKKLLGDDYKVSDRFEQQDVAYKMMQSEKWMIFLILCFILTISLFNMVGSLSMLMIEKQNDVRTLRNMGANNSLIRRIFLFEGWMISGFGAFLGILVGIVLCLLQQNLGLIKMGTAGSFVIDKYPVLVASADIIIILATVLLVGFLSAWYPVYRLGDRWIKDK
jgi:ABC-type lipoprotein release transport system permease subunit